MRSLAMATAVSGIAVTVLALSTSRGEAHKPITSPFTFNEDVLPIFRAQCGGCHVDGGVAPMALMTHADAVPWGESIRAELMGGQMPPWSVDGARGRFHNAQALTARELNVLLTWVSGGTPAGNPAEAPLAAAPDPGWRLGPPDLELPLPEFELPADTQEQLAEFTIAGGAREPLWVRAIDVRPGTPAIVRGATVRLERRATSRVGTTMTEPVLAVWVPGDLPVALDGNAAFLLPPGAEIVVSMHYKKTWEYERQVMTDRSTIGIYLAAAPAPELQSLALAPDDRAAAEARDAAVSGVSQTPLTYTQTIQQDLLALAIYPDAALTDARVTVIAARPDGSRDVMISLRN
jgi:hypothetical protein